MNLATLENYIKVMDFASDFHYAVNQESPWTPFTKEIRECNIALVTTGGLHLKDDQPFELVNDYSYREISGDISLDQLMITHEFYEHTETDQDLNAIFPLDRLRELAAKGEIGKVNETHFSFMGFIPEWEPLLDSAREVASKLKDQEVDLVILTPGSPFCNHSTGLIQREIEAFGIPTISLTVEREITAQVKPPRALYVGFPAGCPVGEPFDREKQLKVLREIFSELKAIKKPGTIRRTPFKWTRSCSAPQCKLP